MPTGIYIRTKEHNENVSKSLKGRKFSVKHCKNISKSKKGVPVSREHKDKISRILTGRHKSEETKEKLSKSCKGKYVSERTKRQIRRTLKRLWNNPEFREKAIKAMCNGIAKAKPTKPERRLRNHLNYLFPREYKFVGDGSIIIGGRKPDFINVNGQKKIVEMFGDYWHSKELTGRTKGQEENQRINHFVKYGFKTLIVWQYELRNIKRLRRKLMKFHLEKFKKGGNQTKN